MPLHNIIKGERFFKYAREGFLYKALHEITHQVKSRVYAFLSKYIRSLLYGEVLREDERFIVLIFDVEEDLDFYSELYYNSFKYIDSGAFNDLISLLDDLDICATFYITPQVAEHLNDMIKESLLNTHSLGVHLHPHNVVRVNYPFYSRSIIDHLSLYKYDEKLTMMQRAKSRIERVLDRKIFLFRSGRLCCDDEIEKIASILGYKAISNHRYTYYIKPLKIWNLDAGKHDLFVLLLKHGYKPLVKCITKSTEKIIALPGHPMRLYNYQRGKIISHLLSTFSSFIKTMIKEGNVHFIDQYRLLLLLERRLKMNTLGCEPGHNDFNDYGLLKYNSIK